MHISLKIMVLMITILSRNLKYKKGVTIMDELYTKLNAIPDSYFGFVMGIISYAKRKPERLDKVLRYLNEAPNPTSSDVVKFVMEQPDFHEYGLGLKEMAG